MSSRTPFRPVFGPKTKAQTKRANQRARRRRQPRAVDARLANPTTGVKSKRRPARGLRNNASANAITSDYLSTLNNPFEYPGVRMGFGCLIPTQLTMAYVKGTLSPNADGSFRIVGVPWNSASGSFNGSVGFTSVTGVNTAPTYLPLVSANLTQMVANFNLARVISGGVRVSVKYPATSTPGILNCFTSSNSSSAATATTNQAGLSLPQAKLSGSDGAQVLYRPTDTNDTEFGSLVASGGGLLASSQLYVDGIGYPTGSTVYYEIVYHLEVYSTILNGVADLGQESGFPTLSDIHANIESMMSKVRTSLVSDIIPLTGAGLFSLAGLQRPTRLLRGAAAAA